MPMKLARLIWPLCNSLLLGSLLLGTLRVGDVAMLHSAQAAPATNWSKLIKYIVFIVKENHTFDSYFGRFPNARGVPGVSGTVKGKGCTANFTPPPATCSMQMAISIGNAPNNPTNFNHERDAVIKDYDKGKMDGFNFGSTARPPAKPCSTSPYPCYIAAQQSLIPYYWNLAKNYVLNDNGFSSFMGPSFPNHLYTVAAAAGPNASQSVIANPVNPSGTQLSWGCDANSGTRVELENGNNVFPCFSNFPTLADQMDAASPKVTWKYFTPAPGDPGYTLNTLDAFSKDYKSPNIIKDTSFTQFDNLAKSGKLPQFSWLVPPNAKTEHPGSASGNGSGEGEKWTMDRIKAIQSNSTEWGRTLIVVVWDDFGGLYDHVPPPMVGGLSEGFRVPFLIVSPYACATDNPSNPNISHVHLEFTSILQFAEQIFGLSVGSLGGRDQAMSINNLAKVLSPTVNTAKRPLMHC